VNIFSRIFAYPILERELLNRIADRDRQIVSQQIRIEDLESRLFLSRGLPVKGEINVGMAAVVPSYRTGRQRLRKMVTPPLVTEEKLTAEEEKQIAESLTQ